MTDTVQPAWPSQRPGHPHDELVASYLLIDIQHASVWAEELCEHVRLVSSGEEKNWIRVGNAYHLILTHDTASIETLDEPGGGEPTLVALDEFRVAAESWRDQLKGRNEE